MDKLGADADAVVVKYNWVDRDRDLIAHCTNLIASSWREYAYEASQQSHDGLVKTRVSTDSQVS